MLAHGLISLLNGHDDRARILGEPLFGRLTPGEEEHLATQGAIWSRAFPHARRDNRENGGLGAASSHPAGGDEVDRATMPIRRRSLRQTSFLRKLLAYYETWLQKLHTQVYGIKSFRVLTVTTSADRLTNILAANREATDGKGSRMFLFVDQSTLAAANPLTALWRNGRDELTRLTD